MPTHHLLRLTRGPTLYTARSVSHDGPLAETPEVAACSARQNYPDLAIYRVAATLDRPERDAHDDSIYRAWPILRGEQLPAWRAFGPHGAEVTAILDRLLSLSVADAARLAAAAAKVTSLRAAKASHEELARLLGDEAIPRWAHRFDHGLTFWVKEHLHSLARTDPMLRAELDSMAIYKIYYQPRREWEVLALVAAGAAAALATRDLLPVQAWGSRVERWRKVVRRADRRTSPSGRTT